LAQQWGSGDAALAACARGTDEQHRDHGSRLRESVEAGPITYTENVYAIFLISDGT
jgi:hypothetical protein